MGNGLVSNDGPHWVKQRKLMQPLFSNRNVNGFDGTINRLTSSLMSQWDARAGDEIIWIDSEMSRLTFRIVGATLFGGDIERHAGEIAEIQDVVNLRPQEMRALMTLYSWIPAPYNLKWKRATRRLDRIVYGMIAVRRRAGTGGGGGDILDRLLNARDEETGEGIDETQVRDEVVTLMLAGHETSANALAWTLYLLATHPEVEARLTEDLAARLNGAPATAADLPRIPYLKQVVQDRCGSIPRCGPTRGDRNGRRNSTGMHCLQTPTLRSFPMRFTGTRNSGPTRSGSIRTGSNRTAVKPAIPFAI